MTKTQAQDSKEKKETITKIVSVIGEKHAGSLGRLPLNTLKALVDKIGAVSDLPAGCLQQG